MLERPTSQIRKERFEFKLTVNDNIICQRYFKINSFNENSLKSIELKDTIDFCVGLIDNDLKSKSRVYTWHTAPLVFNSKTEMDSWLCNPNHTDRIRFGESLYLRDSTIEYWWDGEKAVKSEMVLNDGEFSSPIDETPVVFKFVFLDSGKEIYTKVWDGNFYPKFIRNGVDLSNKKGKFDGDDVTKLNFESSLLHYMVNDKTDLVSVIIKEICDICTVNSKKWYTTSEVYETTTDKRSDFDENGNEKITYIKKGPKMTYDFSIENSWNRYVNKMANIYKSKTEEYFKNL